MAVSQPDDGGRAQDADAQHTGQDPTTPYGPGSELRRDSSDARARGARILWFWPVAAVGLVAAAGAFGDWRVVAATTAGLGALAISALAAATRSHAVAIVGFLVAAAALGFVMLRADATGRGEIFGPRESSAALVARKDIPPFHIVEDADLTVGAQPLDDGGGYAPFPVSGRMTTKRLPKGAAIRNGDLLPGRHRLRAPVAVTGFQVTRAATLNGLLRPGDSVELWFADGSSRGEIRLPAIVISVAANVARGPRSDSLVVALESRAAKRDLARLDGEHLAIIRRG